MSTPRFQIGDSVFWVYSSVHYSKKIPCEICFGKRGVVIILGDGSRQETACDACALQGYPTGLSTIWEPHVEVREGVIDGVMKDSSGGWCYQTGHETLKEHQLFISRDAAQTLFEEKLKEVEHTAKAWRVDQFRRHTKKQTWSASYHRKEIKYHQARVAWHQEQLKIPTPDEE